MSPTRVRPVPRHGRQRQPRPVGFFAKLTGSVVAVAVIGALGVGTLAAADVVTSVQPSVHLAQLPGASAVSIPPDVAAIDGGVNLLLVGTDTRTGQGAQYQDKADLNASSGAGNNDVTMLLHISEDHSNATVVSFPRDLMIPIPSCPTPSGGHYSAMSKVMLNSALTYGGLPCPVLTIQKLTGLKSIPFAAEISFDGVAEMSNAVGGVTVCVASAIDDPYVAAPGLPPLKLSAGNHTLQGEQALQFVRSRHGVGDGSDLGRISNQQVFLSALMRTITQEGVLTNPIKLYSLAKAATQNLTLSDTLAKPTTLVQIALALKSIPLQNITFVQYPTVGDPDNPNRVIPQSYAAQQVDLALQQDKPIVLTGGTGRGSVAETPPPTTGAPTSPASPTTPATGSTPTPSDTAAAQLPSSVTGQTAAEQTCSKGQTAYPGEG